MNANNHLFFSGVIAMLLILVVPVILAIAFSKTIGLISLWVIFIGWIASLLIPLISNKLYKYKKLNNNLAGKKN